MNNIAPIKVNIIRHKFQVSRTGKKIIFNFILDGKDEKQYKREHVLLTDYIFKVNQLLRVLSMDSKHFNHSGMSISHHKGDLFEVTTGKQSELVEINERKRSDLKKLVKAD